MRFMQKTSARSRSGHAVLERLLRRRRLFALVLALAFAPLVFSGCYGRFPITRSLYRWNGDVGTDKYVTSLLFWPLVPVYGVCIIVDALIINLIEFWSGDRIVRETRVIQPDGTELAMLPGASAGEALLTLSRDGHALHTLRIERVSDRELRVRDEQGRETGSAWRDTTGRIELRDAAGRTVAVTSEREFPHAALSLGAL